jgi:RNA polymerase sigma-70 factor (ECF subfamily)
MEHLGARLAVGDQAAFAELYAACADRLHHYLTVRLGSRQDAEDVLQETFVRLARNRDKLQSVRNLAAYVFTIARNESNRLAERKKRGPAENADVNADALFDEATSDDLSRRETAALVAGALSNLPPNEREVIELKIYAGLTFREIAEVTGSPQGTVATRYRAGLGHLRLALTEQLP